MPESGEHQEARDDAQELAHMGKVDVHPDVHRATESDEEEVLRRLYGEPDEQDFYRGEGS